MTDTAALLRVLDDAQTQNYTHADLVNLCVDAADEIRRLEKHQAITEAVVEALEEIVEWPDATSQQKAEVREILGKLRRML